MANLIYLFCNGEYTLRALADRFKSYYSDIAHQIDIDICLGIREMLNDGVIIIKPGHQLPIHYRDKNTVHELCILFLYHKVDDITLQNFDLLTFLNPEDVVVPLALDPAQTIPSLLETIDVASLASEWDLSNVWRSVDAVVYTWFRNRKSTARRYCIMEYDCL
ncbi:MAG: hypothetical protein ACI9FD_002226 [Gammaproteobacteria bacterium]|jgi:hypothetical protein